MLMSMSLNSTIYFVMSTAKKYLHRCTKYSHSTIYILKFKAAKTPITKNLTNSGMCKLGIFNIYMIQSPIDCELCRDYDFSNLIL